MSAKMSREEMQKSGPVKCVHCSTKCNSLWGLYMHHRKVHPDHVWPQNVGDELKPKPQETTARKTEAPKTEAPKTEAPTDAYEMVVGDVVTLKSGGIPMTVVSLPDYENVRCMYCSRETFGGAMLHTIDLPSVCLMGYPQSQE